jgi:hypothetical protein
MPFDLDTDGFLVDGPEFSWMAERSNVELVTVLGASQSGALVLLGEPGVGKTTVLSAITSNLRCVDDAGDSEPGLLWVDGAELTDVTADVLLLRHLEGLPRAPTPEIKDRAPIPSPQQNQLVGVMFGLPTTVEWQPSRAVPATQSTMGWSTLSMSWAYRGEVDECR